MAIFALAGAKGLRNERVQPKEQTAAEQSEDVDKCHRG